jgi:hypothetical protein
VSWFCLDALGHSRYWCQRHVGLFITDRPVRVLAVLDQRSPGHRTDRAAKLPARPETSWPPGPPKCAPSPGANGRNRGAVDLKFDPEDGWRYTLWVTNRPADTKGCLGPGRLHRRRPPSTHRSRTRSAPARMPAWVTSLCDFAVDAAWLTAAITGRSRSPGSGDRPGRQRHMYGQSATL